MARARLVWGVVAGMLAIQALVESRGGYQYVSWWYETFGLRRSEVFAGKVWQVFSYAWLHGNFLHVSLNALGVLLLGAKMEVVLGSKRFLQILTAGVVGGAVGHMALAVGGRDAPPLVGMSGGCVGILLLATTLSPESRMFPLPVSGRSLGAGILMATLLLVLLDPQGGLPGFSRGGRWLVDQGMGSWFSVGHACHLGGGVAGWLYGRWLLRPRVTLARLRQERERREARLRNDL